MRRMVIGIAAPASAFDRGLFERGAAALREMGFAVAAGEAVFEAHGRFAGGDAARASELNRLFADPAVDAILCARGGWGSMRILPAIDYRAIARRPKPFVGFSDATALLAALEARCGCPVFHGPMATTLADAGEETRAGLAAALRGEGPREIPLGGARVLRGGRAQGRIAGGNLTTLCHLLGTPFAPRFDGRILFLEDCGEAPYRIDRMLTQLRLAGGFAGVRGLLLGRFTDCGDPEEVLAAAAEAVAGFDFPVVAGVAAGHGEPNLTIPFCAPARLDADLPALAFSPAAGRR